MHSFHDSEIMFDNNEQAEACGQKSGFRAEVLGFKVLGSGFWVSVLGLVTGSRFVG